MPIADHKHEMGGVLFVGSRDDCNLVLQRSRHHGNSEELSEESKVADVVRQIQPSQQRRCGNLKQCPSEAPPVSMATFAATGKFWRTLDNQPGILPVTSCAGELICIDVVKTVASSVIKGPRRSQCYLFPVSYLRRRAASIVPL